MTTTDGGPDDTAGFPALHARTRGFTLGRPRSVTLAEDGSRALFLRAAAGDDPVTSLWMIETATGRERLVVDAGALSAGEVPPEERARRERARETASGIVAYATDRAVETAVFALDGRLWRVAVDGGDPHRLPSPPGAFDPRPDPAGRRVVYVVDGVLRLHDDDGDRVLAAEDGVAWGVAEFIAAEEMERTRGHWWAPDGTAVAACRVDERRVASWWIADPSQPQRPATRHRYPAAGGDNADVRLFVLDVGDGGRVEVSWDRREAPYLADVRWRPGEPLTLTVQSRDQRTVRILTADPTSGETTEVAWLTDADWVELVPGVPAWVDGRLVTVVDDRDADTRRLVVEGEPVTPVGLQVRAVAAVDGGRVVFTASGDDPTTVTVHEWSTDGRLSALTDDEQGVTAVTGVAGARVEIRSDLATAPTVELVTPGTRRTLGSAALDPPIVPAPRLLRLGDRGLCGALLLPGGEATRGPLPVLLDPYGGPHVQRVLASRHAYLASQWLADQGFAVLVVDGRGTPGRGPAWVRAIRGDLAGPALDDQVDGLRAAAEQEPRLDLDRVAIRGWSFGGFLAALAVLRRPDVFRAGVAGAPVTDWRLYDTHYTERYLGLPAREPEAYRRSSLVDERQRLVGAAPDRGARLLVIHGLADDNVVAAHALRLSAAMLADGRAHRFLPLSGVTHMTPQETVAQRLLEVQVDFLHEALG